MTKTRSFHVEFQRAAVRKHLEICRPWKSYWKRKGSQFQDTFRSKNSRESIHLLILFRHLDWFYLSLSLLHRFPFSLQEKKSAKRLRRNSIHVRFLTTARNEWEPLHWFPLQHRRTWKRRVLNKEIRRHRPTCLKHLSLKSVPRPLVLISFCFLCLGSPWEALPMSCWIALIFASSLHRFPLFFFLYWVWVCS